MEETRAEDPEVVQPPGQNPFSPISGEIPAWEDQQAEADQPSASPGDSAREDRHTPITDAVLELLPALVARWTPDQPLSSLEIEGLRISWAKIERFYGPSIDGEVFMWVQAAAATGVVVLPRLRRKVKDDDLSVPGTSGERENLGPRPSADPSHDGAVDAS